MKNDCTDPNLAFDGRFMTSAYRGVAVIFGVRGDQVECSQGTYEFGHHRKPHPHVRAYRQDRWLRGKKNEPLPKEALRDELIVVPGAGMTPEATIASLRALIGLIEREGLLVGKAENDLFVQELPNAPRFVAPEANDKAIELT